jgi:peroxiredoxin
MARTGEGRTVFARAALLAVWAFLTIGAQPPPKEQPRELHITTEADAKGVTLRIRNAYSAPASSWTVACQADGGGKGPALWHWGNPDWSLEGTRLGPGQETLAHIPTRFRAADPGKCENFRLTAAVFADGTVTGDLRWILATIAEQRLLSEDIGKAIEMLTKAAAAGTPPAQAVQEFVTWQQSALPAGIPAEPSQGATGAYGSSSNGITPPPARAIARARVPAAVRWLIQVKRKDLAQSLQALAGWRERIVGKLPLEGISTGPGVLSQGRRPLEPTDMPGKPAPSFTLQDVDGKHVALQELRGKAVFLTFWATWCVPCRAEMPQFQALHEEFRGRGLVVLGINFSEPPETARAYFTDQKLTFGNLLDPGSKVFERFGGGAIPKAVLIDKVGTVRYYQSGFSSAQDFRAEVGKLGL